jgi:hypothetical protein
LKTEWVYQMKWYVKPHSKPPNITGILRYERLI